MDDVTGSLLLLLVLLQVKHMLADYFLQTSRMLAGRATYLHRGRAEHATVHVVGSVLVFAIVGAPALFVLWIVIAEWIAHFHIDWLKAWWSDHRNPKLPLMRGFGAPAGVDQACHQLTYLAMGWAWATYAI